MLCFISKQSVLFQAFMMIPNGYRRREEHMSFALFGIQRLLESGWLEIYDCPWNTQFFHDKVQQTVKRNVTSTRSQLRHILTSNMNNYQTSGSLIKNTVGPTYHKQSEDFFEVSVFLVKFGALTLEYIYNRNNNRCCSWLTTCHSCVTNARCRYNKWHTWM